MPAQFRYSLFAMCIAAAVPQLATAQTFEDLETRLRGHPSLIAMDYRASAQEERAVAATALPDPVVSLGINNFPIYDPSFNAYLPTNKAVGIRQQFPNLAGREARAGQARAMADQTSTQLEARYAVLRSDLLALLIDKRRIETQRSLANSRNAKYDELLDVAEAEIDSGRPVVYRLAEIEGERTEVDRTLVDLDQQEAEIDARFIDLVGLVPVGTDPQVTPERWSGRALDFHLVRVAESEIEVTDYGVDEAKSEWKPEWGAQLTYQQRDAGAMFAGDDWVSGMVTFTVPIWAERKQAPRLRAAKADRASAEQRYQAAARTAAAQYAALDAAIRAAERSISVIQTRIRAIEDEVAAQLTIYESGVGGYAPIIDGEVAILKLKSEIAAEQSRRDIATARSNALLVQP